MFTKNDLKTLPFEKLPDMVVSTRNKLKEERLGIYKTTLEKLNQKKIADYTKELSQQFNLEGEDLEKAVEAALINTNEIDLPAEVSAECFAIAKSQVIGSFLASTDLGNKWAWVLPQLMAYFAKEIEPIKNESGKYDGKLTISNIEDNFSRGLWYIAMWSRSDLIKGTPLYKVGEYNNLVPLILSAYKVYHGISYNSWDRVGLSFIVDSDLYAAMTCEVPNLTPENWLEIRQRCLKYATGPKAGQLRNPTTTSMLYGVKDYPEYPELASLPKYALVMLAQIWCAHPANRTARMVLNPRDWDGMPAPIIDTMPLVSASTKQNTKLKFNTGDGVPWL